MLTPKEGQVVFVHGGVAQYRNGTYYSGMEDPRYQRAIQWDVTWWLPLDWNPLDECSRIRYTNSMKAEISERRASSRLSRENG